MTDDEFQKFLERSMSEIHRKQDLLSSGYGLGTFAAFWFDQAKGTLEFRDHLGRTQLLASVVPIGSHSVRSNTWMWAWANPSILPPLRKQAEALRELATETGVAAFEQPTIAVTANEMPWELAAFAVHRLGALGAYKAPGRDSDLYLAILAVTKAAR